MRSSATAVHIHGGDPGRWKGRMTSADDDTTMMPAEVAGGEPGSPPSGGFAPARGTSPGGPPDHAGSVLSRLLIAHPEVAGLEMLGQMDTPEGIIYSLGVMLPDGRELLIDVGYV